MAELAVHGRSNILVRLHVDCRLDFLGTSEPFLPDKVGILQGLCSITYLSLCNKSNYLRSTVQKYLQPNAGIDQTRVSLLIFET